MNAFFLTALVALSSSPAAADAPVVLTQHVDMHKVTAGAACTYSRPGRCERELEVVGRANVTIKVNTETPLTPAQQAAAQAAAKASLVHATKCLSRVQFEDVRPGSIRVAHFDTARQPSTAPWPLNGQAFFARCIEHRTSKYPLPEGSPSMLIEVELDGPAVRGIRKKG